MKEKEINAAIKIQKWFRRLPFRKEGILISNGNEQKLKLAAIDIKEREFFIQEVKERRFKDIALHQHPISLAISALKANKISSIEAYTVIEIAQFVANHQIEHVQFETFLDTQNQFTRQAYEYLQKIYSSQLDKMRTDLRDFNLFLVTLKEHLIKNPLANLFYLIEDQFLARPQPEYEEGRKSIFDYHTSDFFNLPPGFKASAPYLFLNPSFVARDVLGKLFYGADWSFKEYRIGNLSIDDIDLAKQRNIVPASISTKEINLDPIADGGKVTSEGSARHDEYHRQQSSMIPKTIRRAMARVVWLIRKNTEIKWSAELWEIIDRDYALACQKYRTDSPEMFFYRTVSPISLLNVADRSSSSSSPQTLISQIKSKTPRTSIAANNNATSVVMWIMVMDMTDNPKIWREQFNIRVEQKDLHYDRHIALYRSLKENPDFQKLEVKQKIAFLDITFHSLGKIGNPNDSFDYPVTFKKENIVDSAFLFFRKVKKSEDIISGRRYTNCICIERTDPSEQPQEKGFQPFRAISRFH